MRFGADLPDCGPATAPRVPAGGVPVTVPESARDLDLSTASRASAFHPAPWTCSTNWASRRPCATGASPLTSAARRPETLVTPGPGHSRTGGP
jgi:hypothetical protein